MRMVNLTKKTENLTPIPFFHQSVWIQEMTQITVQVTAAAVQKMVPVCNIWCVLTFEKASLDQAADVGRKQAAQLSKETAVCLSTRGGRLLSNKYLLIHSTFSSRHSLTRSPAHTTHRTPRHPSTSKCSLIGPKTEVNFPLCYAIG